MLKVNNISIRFGGLKALTDVSFVLEEGKISALIGPNGAGKTTLFNVITGFLKPTSGNIFFNETDITNYEPHKIFSMGISRTFQNLNLIHELTLRENLLLGFIGKDNRSVLKNIFRLDGKYWKDKELLIDEYLEFTGISKWQDYKPNSTPYGVLKTLEMTRALLSNPRFLLLDEPAAGLNNSEKERLSLIVKEIVKKGISVFMVEHDMSFISSLSDFVVCLNFGEVIASGSYHEIRENDAVLKAYLGDTDA